MKTVKLLSVAIAVLFSLTLCGCDKAKDGENETQSNTQEQYSVNILAYAQKGQIPEVPFALHTAVDEVKTGFKDTLPEGSEIEDLLVTEGAETVWLDGGNVIFCYEKAKSENGISVLVAKENAYNFSLGGVFTADDVISAVASKDYVRTAATENDAFFLPVIPENCECITYTAGNYVLRFIFTDDYLSAVTLTDPTLWQ